MIAAVLLAWSAVYWVVLLAVTWRSKRALLRVIDLPQPARTEWPLVSAVVPARNEGAHLGEALRSRLVDGYPSLEVVLVDDRSTDDTLAQARALATQDPRLTVAQVEVLPAGWLGKLNALHTGLQASRGAWVLFSDADVQFAPGTLARVVAWAEAEGVDHVTVLPEILPSEVLVGLSLDTFFRSVIAGGRLWAVADPQSSAAVGVGAFNLVRRVALDRSPGLEWLKMEVADDMALGVMLKRAGARQRILIGKGALSLQFYPSYRALLTALEKNGASLPLAAGLGALVALVVAELGWLAGFAVAWPLALAVAATAAAVSLTLSGWVGHARWPALVPGLGAIPFAWALARSLLLATLRGGATWRGTFYPMAAVREGQRLTGLRVRDEGPRSTHVE